MSYSIVPVCIEGIVAGLWLGSVGVFGVIGAWMIVLFNFTLLFKAGRKLFSINWVIVPQEQRQPIKGVFSWRKLIDDAPADVQLKAKKGFMHRFVLVAVLLLVLSALLGPYLDVFDIGIIFLTVYLTVTVIFAVVVIKSQTTYK